MAMTITAITQQASHLVGNWYMKTYTWDANNTAKGEIVTGFSNIIAAGISTNEANTEQPQWDWNVDEDGAAEAGTVGFLSFADQVNNTGKLWVIGEL